MALIMLFSILLVILPAVLVTTTAANASSTHTRKCKECTETKAQDRFQSTRHLVCRACNTKKQKAAQAQKVAATPPVPSRRCSRCTITKAASEFTSDKSQPGGLSLYCRLCKSFYAISRSQKYQATLKDSQFLNCTMCKKDKPADQMRTSESKCLDCNSKYKQAYDARRYATDENFRLGSLLRRRVLDALKGANKSQRTMDLLGCTIEDFKHHIMQQFHPGMTMENQGLWHLDHIRPCADWDLTKPEDQAGCFHYSNYQPLWATDNLSKGAKLDWSPATQPWTFHRNDQPTVTHDAGISEPVMQLGSD